MRAARRLVALLVVCALAGGCVSLGPAQAAPGCEPGGEDTLVLVAQSVPSAAMVPCISSLPSGWFVNAVEIDSEGTQLQLGSHSFDLFLIEMAFDEACDTGTAVEVPSQDEGVARFETVSDIDDGYAGKRFYVFDGGCTTLRFDVRGEGWSGVVNDASTAFSFRSRSQLRQYVRERTDGAASL